MVAESLQHFLIVYDNQQQGIVELRQFAADEEDAAVEAFGPDRLDDLAREVTGS
ncbi:MAG: hypothetical protein L0206_11405 [Actinobacteria bacterium]|nr:hypothetical protein [Actinomycetota bacterium]